MLLTFIEKYGVTHHHRLEYSFVSTNLAPAFQYRKYLRDRSWVSVYSTVYTKTEDRSLEVRS